MVFTSPQTLIISLTNEVPFRSSDAAGVFAALLRKRAEQRGAAGLLLLASGHHTSALLLMWKKRMQQGRGSFYSFSSLSGALHKCFDVSRPQAVF